MDFEIVRSFFYSLEIEVQKVVNSCLKLLRYLVVFLGFEFGFYVFSLGFFVFFFNVFLIDVQLMSFY